MFAASKSGSPAEATDAQFNYVTMLLHGDGTNGAQNNTFLDSSTNNFTITRNGNTTQGTFTPYGSNWSNYFGSAGTDYLSFTDTGNTCDLGNATASFEAWVYLTASTSVLINKSGGVASYSTTNGIEYTIASVSGVFTMYYNVAGTFGTLASGSSSTLNTWHHVVIASNTTTLSMYVDGTRVATATAVITKPTTRTTMRIANDLGGTGLAGYISNMRVISGSNAYDASQTTITVPTTPLTAVSGTALLTCQSNRFIDTSSNAFAITVNGSPSVQRFSPFSPTTAYSTSVIGGSGYFDGTTDFVKTPSDVNLSSTLLASNFTIECWIYLAAYPSSGAAIWTNSVTNADGFSSSYINSNGTVGTGKVNVNEFNTTTTIKLNTWTHFALVRNSGTLYVYFNGVQDATTGAASTYLNTSATKPMQIGSSNQSPPTAMQGYISDFRVVASAVYTTGFTPNTAPLTAISGTNLLLSTTNAGILDNAMMNDLETVGNAQISTSVKKYGTGSIAFDGSGDALYSTSQSPTFLTGDFTLEFWIYFNAVNNSTVKYVYDMRNSGATTASFLAQESSNAWTFWNGAGSTLATGFTSSTFAATTWTHVAICRSSGTTKFFVNGTQTGSVADTSSYTNSTLTVGTRYSYSDGLNGYIDDLRITKGVARYTSNFTAPTTAFADKG